jgi:hypothetical protein
MVGRLTMELAVVRKAPALHPLGPAAKCGVILTLAAEYPVQLIRWATGWPRSSLYHESTPVAEKRRLRRAPGRLAAR